MSTFIKVVVICMLAVMVMSCAGRRQQRAMERQMMYQQLHQVQPAGSSCTAPVSGACAECTVQCLVGQSALCRPGESRGDRCAVEPSCRCAPQ